jgi:hypothetical protein
MPLWAAAQAALAKAGPKRVKYTDEDGNIHCYAQGDRLDSCHLYGSSTRNVRIESWWRQLRRGVTDRWITYFNELIGYGLFREDSLIDQVAFYAIYGQIIRDELADFVNLWNGHIIRNQKNRPNIKSGIPIDLYHTAADPDWGVPFDEDDDSPQQQLLRDMWQPLQSIDIDSLLPAETEAWCKAQLQGLGFEANLAEEDDHKRPFVGFYLKLRDLIEKHQNSGLQPILGVSQIHTGGAAEHERLLQRNYLDDPDLCGDAMPPDFSGTNKPGY